ncbi:MAG: endonuclease/exonuclease/phosphatase family protein [Sporichthyaceae bacterium]|nr:endonuclease/exonuclease/phosphatase family protein [Sporichthyaceae bacterium]
MTDRTAELRVLSWNVHGLRDETKVLARIVRDIDPDVVCVQEAPKYLRWRAKCAALARRCGLLYVTGGGTTGGSALFASLRVDVKRADGVCLSRQWGWPARGVAAAVVSKGGAGLVVASIHLPLDAQQRLEHTHRATSVCRSLGNEHALVAGDINERPGHAAWKALHHDGLRDLGPGSGPTYPADGPTKRIDGVLGTERVAVLDYRVVDAPGVERASDHRPVLATVTVPVD